MQTLVENTLFQKVANLESLIAGLEGAVVAYSGGVDSTFLAKKCADLLGERTIAVLGVSETYPAREVSSAITVAERLGLRLEVVTTAELSNPDFIANPPNRCYHCKIELFSRLRQMAGEKGLPNVVDGSNWDDLGDHRPGRQAAQSLGVRSPLQEAGLTKAEIRIVSQQMGLPTWNKPSFACLASRFPYGVRIDKVGLEHVDQVENLIAGLGIGQLRLRHHGSIARIEVDPTDFPLLMEAKNRERIVAFCRELGYAYVTLDLAGYRTGSMNEVLANGQ